MAEGKRRDAWDHTAHVMALTANVNRDPKRSRPFKVTDFHPFLSTRRKRARVSVEQLTREMMSLAKGRQPTRKPTKDISNGR